MQVGIARIFTRGFPHSTQTKDWVAEVFVDGEECDDDDEEEEEEEEEDEEEDEEEPAGVAVG